MVAALGEGGVNRVSRTAGVLVIGAGATACSALAALREIGARDVDVAVRDTSRSGELEAAANRLGVAIRLGELAPPAGARAHAGATPAELVICTVPPRAADAAAEWLCRGPVAPKLVFDVAYAPWPTRLAAAAPCAGSPRVRPLDL